METMCISKNFRGITFTAECLCSFHATKFYLEVGFKDFILKGDAKQVIKLIQGKEHN